MHKIHQRICDFMKHHQGSPVMPVGGDVKNIHLMLVGYQPYGSTTGPFGGIGQEPVSKMMRQFGLGDHNTWQTCLYKISGHEPDHQENTEQWRKLLDSEIRLVKPEAVVLLSELTTKVVLGEQEGASEHTRYARASLPGMCFFTAESPGRIHADLLSGDTNSETVWLDRMRRILKCDARYFNHICHLH